MNESADRIKALISGWAVSPELLCPAQGRDLSAVVMVDPLLEINAEDNGQTPLDLWLSAAERIFGGEGGPVYDTVVGYSLGGILALAAVHAGILKTRQIILAASTLCFVGNPSNDPETDLPVWPGASEAEVKNLRRSIGRDRESAIRAFFKTVIGVSSPNKSREDALVAGAKRYSEAALQWGLDLLASVDLRPQAPSIIVPVMILHGTEDEVIPAAAAARGSHILPNTTPLFINGASHDLFHLAPDLLPALLFGEAPADGG